MKRITIRGIILACFIALCLCSLEGIKAGQRRSRTSPQKIVQLTEPRLSGPISFEDALAKRRSVRLFSSQELKNTQISQLAWAGQGITEPQQGLRTAPSTGRVYPIDLYFATQDGFFVYRPGNHTLEQISQQDIRGDLAVAVSMQEPVTRAGCYIILAGSVRKLMPQFRNKASTYMLIEAGHIAQNIQLQAVCLDLGSVAISSFDTRNIERICRLTRNIEPLSIICVGYPVEPGITEISEEQQSTTKKAVLIVAGENFRDEELFETKRVLEAASVKTTIASTRAGIIKGMLGNIAEASILVDELKVGDYDAIIFIGGTGAVEYFANPVALNIAREAAYKGKVLAAICIAPTILANAGVLTGIRATSYISEQERLQLAGAQYTGTPVERDRFIITASGPAAASQFGKAIADALAGR